MTKRVWLVAAAVLTAYLVTAAPPIRNAVGRRNPSMASWLSPPLFNFDHTYRDGQVLGISIGMTRREVTEVLVTRYVGRGIVFPDCDTGLIANAITLVAGIDAASVRTGEHLCAQLDSAQAIFEFPGGVLVSVRVAYVRTELSL
jgi:hypothetical protein